MSNPYTSTDGRVLDRSSILKAPDMPTDYADAPAWGGRVRVKAIPLGSFEFRRFVEKPIGKGAGEPPTVEEMKVRRIVAAVIMGAIDDDGERLFGWTDADELRAKHWNTVSDVATRVFELSGRNDMNPVSEIVNAAARIYNGLAPELRELYEPVLEGLVGIAELAKEIDADLVDDEGNPTVEIDAYAEGKGSSGTTPD